MILVKRFVSSESLLPYGANPITLYSSEFTLNPKKYVKAEYNSPIEFGYTCFWINVISPSDAL